MSVKIYSKKVQKIKGNFEIIYYELFYELDFFHFYGLKFQIEGGDKL